MAFPISTNYQTALTSGNQNIQTQAILYDNGTPVPGVPPLYVISGSVTADTSQTFFRSFSLKVTDPTGVFTPNQADIAEMLSPGNSQIDPYGMEIALYRGLVGTDASTGQPYPMIPMGVFRVTRVEVYDAPTDFYMNVSGYDRSYTVAQQRWTDVFTITSGTVIDTAMQNIITPRFTFNINFLGFTNTTTSPLLVYGIDSGTNPWQVVTQLGQANGTVVYFDVSGNCVEVAPPIPGVAITPVFSFVEGPTCTITQLQTEWVTENVCNDVIVLGEGTGVTTPTYGRAFVSNPSNPMNITGQYGDCPQIVRSNLATTNTIAQTMAQTQLNINTGLTQTIQMQCIPAPQLDVYDVIYVQRARSGIAAPYIITHIQTPMEAGSLQQITAQLSEFLS